MTQKSKKIAVITGANKGLGYAAAEELGQRGYEIHGLGRNAQAIEAAASGLREKGIAFFPHVVDVSSASSVENFGKTVSTGLPYVDCLINNAGVYLESGSGSSGALSFLTDERTLLETFSINTLSVFRMLKALYPLLKKSPAPRVVNVSSGMGQLSEMGPGFPAYRLSKTAMNAATRIFANEFKSDRILVNSVCPGWVKTAMGGPNAERELAEGIAGIVWAATLPDDGPTGLFFRDGKRLDW